ncbi:transcription initiation factor TFIID subunit 1-like isoform X2 [Corticium candelabrum]|uniref:transcription initiation factor TFIID subunit 1-like isoform X2 n=1 Tax=Corticium candelabrum TaxID=121492 RepID=UPI002E25B0A6|nr:transcription initiation factor TFIID subunit 1-like isoform X2 [Corticium candelabrum]
MPSAGLEGFVGFKEMLESINSEGRDEHNQTTSDMGAAEYQLCSTTADSTADFPMLFPAGDGNKEELYRYVAKVFPEFAPNKVLRFSRLFDAGKSLLPRALKRQETRKRHLSGRSNDEMDWEEVKAKKLTPDMYEAGDEEEFLTSSSIQGITPYSSVNSKLHSANRGDAMTELVKAAEWRHGPAKLVYDMAGIPEDATELDYGFQLKKSEGNDKRKVEYPVEDCFLMVSQVPWEEDVILDTDLLMASGGLKVSSVVANHPIIGAAKQPQSHLQLQRTLSGVTTPSSKSPMTPLSSPAISKLAVPTATAALMLQGSTSGILPSGVQSANSRDTEIEQAYSIFPVENEELVYSNWEEKVILDDQNMTCIPSPVDLKLDPNDENLLIGIPYDPEPQDQSASQQMPTKKERKSKILLGKAGIIKVEQNDSPGGIERGKDPFNISCDEYYMPRHDSSSAVVKIGLHKSAIQHSIPAMELFRDWFPTHLTTYQLRHFHRLPVKAHRVSGNILPICPLYQNIIDKEIEREAERQASGGGDVFFMRKPGDLSAADGDLVLCEYCEEHPPLIMATGMSTKLVNYYKRKPKSDAGAPKLSFGETSYIQKSPFLGNVVPGTTLQALENNLFRAPIYKHGVPQTDFVVIKMGESFYLRAANAMFAVGQECPKFEVPGPESKKKAIHMKDFLQVFIYRLFLKSNDDPRRLRMEDIRKAFPHLGESSIRKRLKGCADFNRTGSDSGWWRLKDGFRLPSEEELRAMVSPEQCCAFYSMQSAKQRLTDAGYGGTSLFAADDDQEEDSQKIDDEVRTAPWNTTRHFIAAAQGKCLLDITGIADPTGCGEGFSYIRIPNKPIIGKDDVREKKKNKTVTGTDADLRKLLLKDAQQVLRNFGVAEEEIKKLSRWEVVDVVRAMSTEAAKQGEGETSRFARGNRFSIAEHQERYKDECQRIFELQNKLLASDAALSTDEGSSSDDDDDEFDQMEKSLENLISSEKTAKQLSHEQEEAEREELKKMLADDSMPKSKSTLDANGKIDDDDVNSVTSFGSACGSRRLIIYRTFSEDGHEFTRREVVKKAAVIDAYVKIASTKDKNFKAHFASQDDQHREEMKREKRRLQEQLRRIKRTQEREKTKPAKPKKERVKPQLTMKCSACGQVGHMKTNKNCPKYKAPASVAPLAEQVPAVAVTPAMTEEQQAAEESELVHDDFQVKVEGTKISFGKAFVDRAESVRRRSLLLKFPRDAVRRRRRGTGMHCDYLQRRHKGAQRRRVSPDVALSGILENILNQLKALPESYPFHMAVSAKLVPDYYNIVLRPMDLQRIRDNIRERIYHSRAEFQEHVQLIVSNSVLYNGLNHRLTEIAQQMLNVCKKEFEENEDKLSELEREINPLLGDDPQVAFSFLLEQVINRMKSVPDSTLFHQPVNAKQVADYYSIVKEAMDLDTLKGLVQDHLFRTREEFIEQAQLIETNSALYNGENSAFTDVSRKVLTTCREALAEYDEDLTRLEEEISLLPEETDSNTGDVPSRSDSIDRDDNYLSQPDLPGGDLSSIGSQATSHSLEISEAAFDAGDLPMFGQHKNFGDSMNVEHEQQQPLLRTSHILMQDLEASDDEDDDDDDDSLGFSAQPKVMSDDDDDVKDEDFVPV